MSYDINKTIGKVLKSGGAVGIIAGLTYLINNLANINMPDYVRILIIMLATSIVAGLNNWLKHKDD